MSDLPPLRRHPRVRAPQVRVKVRYPAERLWELYLKDISRGGLFIRTDVVKPLRTRVSVRLDLDGEPLDFEGEVVHVVSPAEASEHSPAGLGVRFFEPVESSRRVLEALLRKLGGPSAGPSQAAPLPAPNGADHEQRRRTAAELFERAELLLSEGRLDDALGLYQLAVDHDPGNKRFADRLAQVKRK